MIWRSNAFSRLSVNPIPPVRLSACPASPPGRRPGCRASGTSRARRRIRGLVLVPTRELAAQVGEAIVSLAKYLPQRLKVAVVFGGVSINPQMMNLRGGADIIVATPGRLIDLIDHKALTLDVVGPGIGGESIGQAVGLRDHVLFALERIDQRDRAERLLVHDAGVLRHVGHARR